MIINGSTILNLTTGFKTVFNQAFRETESHFEKISSVMPSIGSEDNHCWLGGVPAMREWLGDRVINNP